MTISRIIEDSIPHLRLYDKAGLFISSEVCTHEYYTIRNYLLSHYSTEDTVGLKLDKDYRYILTLLACMSVGLTYIPLSMEWPEDRISQIQELSGCSIIQEEMFSFSEDIINVSMDVFHNETLYIIFTSGSTGIPKGVRIPRMAYEAFLLWVGKYFQDISAGDRMLLTTDFTFDISLVDISLLLTKHLSLYVSHFNNNVFKLLYELENYKITTHSTVPYNYSMIMHDNVYPKADLSSLKHIMIGGARFPNNLYTRFEKYLTHCDIYNFYGPTEATIYCAIHHFQYEDSEIYENNITIGTPFDTNGFSVISDELYLCGPQLMQGYLKNKEKTQEVLCTIEGKMYYKTGDIVFQNEQGNYFIVGRTDDTVKVTGYRVNLSDIDAYVLQLSYVNNVATIAVENETSENDLVSYIILDDHTMSSKQIKDDLKVIMPAYQIPKLIRIVEKFPLNNSGKICKRTLKEQFVTKT